MPWSMLTDFSKGDMAMPENFEHFYFIPTEKADPVYTVDELKTLARDGKLSEDSVKKLILAISHHRFQLEELMILLGEEDDIPF